MQDLDASHLFSLALFPLSTGYHGRSPDIQKHHTGRLLKPPAEVLGRCFSGLSSLNPVSSCLSLVPDVNWGRSLGHSCSCHSRCSVLLVRPHCCRTYRLLLCPSWFLTCWVDGINNMIVVSVFQSWHYLLATADYQKRSHSWLHLGSFLGGWWCLRYTSLYSQDPPRTVPKQCWGIKEPTKFLGSNLRFPLVKNVSSHLIHPSPMLAIVLILMSLVYSYFKLTTTKVPETPSHIVSCVTFNSPSSLPSAPLLSILDFIIQG